MTESSPSPVTIVVVRTLASGALTSTSESAPEPVLTVSADMLENAVDSETGGGVTAAMEKLPRPPLTPPPPRLAI